MEYPAIVTLVALLEFTFFSIKVGSARATYNVAAPAVSGTRYGSAITAFSKIR